MADSVKGFKSFKTVCQNQNSDHNQFFHKTQQHNEYLFLQKHKLCSKKYIKK